MDINDTHFYILFMFATWVYVSLMGYEHDDTLLLYIQFFVQLPLVLYLGSIAFFDGLVLGYGITFSLLCASIYFIFLGTAFSYEDRKKK